MDIAYITDANDHGANDERKYGKGNILGAMINDIDERSYYDGAYDDAWITSV